MIQAGSRDFIEVDDVLVMDNSIHDNANGGIAVWSNGSSNSSGTGSSNRALVSGNEIFDNDGPAISVNAAYMASGESATSASAFPRLVDNAIHGNASGIRVSASDSRGSFGSAFAGGVIANNLISHNDGAGIEFISNGEGHVGPTIVNNTIIENGVAGIRHDPWSGNIAGVAMQNNVIANNVLGIEGTELIRSNSVVGFNDVFNNINGNWGNYSPEFGDLTSTNANGSPADANMNLAVDPLLGPLGDHGGITLTGDGFVDFDDLTILLAHWDQIVSAGQGNLVDPLTTPINFQDLTLLLAAWTGPVGAAQAAAVGGTTRRRDEPRPMRLLC